MLRRMLAPISAAFLLAGCQSGERHARPSPTPAAANATAAPEAAPVEGLSAAQQQVLARAHGIDAKLADAAPGVERPLDRYAAEGAAVSEWQLDGALARAVVESRGETHAAIATIYFDGHRPFLARRFVHFDPTRLTDEGTAEHAAAAAARYTETLVYFFNDGAVTAITTTGRIPASEPARFDDGALVEPAMSVVRPLDEGEREEATATIEEAVGATLNPSTELVLGTPVPLRDGFTVTWSGRNHKHGKGFTLGMWSFSISDGTQTEEVEVRDTSERPYAEGQSFGTRWSLQGIDYEHVRFTAHLAPFTPLSEDDALALAERAAAELGVPPDADKGYSTQNGLLRVSYGDEGAVKVRVGLFTGKVLTDP